MKKKKQTSKVRKTIDIYCKKKFSLRAANKKKQGLLRTDRLITDRLIVSKHLTKQNVFSFLKKKKKIK